MPSGFHKGWGRLAEGREGGREGGEGDEGVGVGDCLFFPSLSLFFGGVAQPASDVTLMGEKKTKKGE